MREENFLSSLESYNHHITSVFLSTQRSHKTHLILRGRERTSTFLMVVATKSHCKAEFTQGRKTLNFCEKSTIVTPIAVELMNDHIDYHSCCGILACCNKKAVYGLQQINGALIEDFSFFFISEGIWVAVRVTCNKVKEKTESIGKSKVEKDEVRNIV